MENALITLFPTKCSFCGKNSGQICPDCLFSAKQVESSFCIVCEQPSISGNTHAYCSIARVPRSIFSPFIYTSVVRDCIKRAKYSARLFYPLKRLSYEGAKYFSKSGNGYKDFRVVPIPLSRKKAKERGFNQATIISEVLSKQTKLTLQENVLFRKRFTKAQHENTREARFKNVKDAFYAKNVQDKNILLVDDICTSGATFFESTKALYAAGAKEVHCFSLSKKFLFKNKRSKL